MEIALKASFFLSSSNNAPLVSLDTAAVVCKSGLHQQMRVCILLTMPMPARHHGCLTSSRKTSSGSNLDEDLTGGQIHTHLLCEDRGQRLSAWRHPWICARVASRWRGARRHPLPQSWVRRAVGSRPGYRCSGSACGGTERKHSEGR
jgi:hypothetical protein